MKLLAAALLLVACKSEPSKLEGKVKPPEISGEIGVRLQKIDDRLKALEEAHAVGKGGPNDPVADRIHRIESTLSRREEALAFLELAHAQQKQQMDAQQANEPDPNAVFAVDIAAPLKAGQVEGPNSATVTVVEAWDFA